jgi:surfactin synthase thioesterase subunit
MIQCTPANPWLVRFGNRGAGAGAVRLFCLPYVGGAASAFRPWADSLLPPAVQVCAVEYPGRETRFAERPFTRSAALVDALGTILMPYLDRPFAIFGHSMGALLGFELCRVLAGLGVPAPIHFFPSGRRAPSLAGQETAIHKLPDADILGMLRAFGGTTNEMLADRGMMSAILPTLRADFEVCETHVHAPGPPLACPVTAFGGLADPVVGHDDLLPWERETTGPFAVRMFPGDHFFLHSARRSLLDAIATALLRDER